MVTIKYNKNPHIFELEFFPGDFIPKEYFERYNKAAELIFFYETFKRNNMFILKPELRIWSIEIRCSYENILFTMSYDEDYGFVSFMVDNSDDRVKIADILRNFLICRKKIRR